MNNLFYFLLIVEIFLGFAKSDFGQKLQKKYDCPANCVDVWRDCSNIANFCENSKNGTVVRLNCPCTCQVCDVSTTTTTTPPTNQYKCRPVNLIFVLDTSQSIDGNFFNTRVRAFVKTIARVYPMFGEIIAPSSRIGVVEFATFATVTYPLIERTRAEFENTIDQGVYYGNQGITNISLGLDTALGELMRVGIVPKDNVMIILVTDGVSTLDIRQTEPSADKVRAYTKFFAGVGIDEINGNDISANLTNLQLLLGNRNLAFADISHAENPITGIWPESRKIYPCPVKPCKGVIFIGEMTEVIAQERKEIFLNSTLKIAQYLNFISGSLIDQLEFSIATYGNGTIRPIQFQTYVDFMNDLYSLIQNVSANDLPNAGHTNTNYILDDLYSVITSKQLKDYLVLFMGQTERILDIQLTDQNAKKLASTAAEIFVLDMTKGNWNNDYLFKNLVKNDMSKIYNYSSQGVSDLTKYYTTGQFAQVWTGMNCSDQTVNNPSPVHFQFCKSVIFVGEMTDVIEQETKEIILNSTKQIAAYFNANPGNETIADQLRFSIVIYDKRIIRPIILRNFTDFNAHLDILINNVTSANFFNSTETTTSSIVNNLYNTVTSDQSKNYLVLFMGESENILDPLCTIEIINRLQKQSKAEIFVLDMTDKNKTYESVFNDLVNSNLNRIYDYTGQNVADLTNYYTKGKFAEIWNAMTCVQNNAEPVSVCDAFFDMFLIIKQSTKHSMSLLQNIAKYLNSRFTAKSGKIDFTKRGLVQYGSSSNVISNLTFDIKAIAKFIDRLAADPVVSNNHASGYAIASDLMKRQIATRKYAKNIIVLISDVYPISTEEQCAALLTAKNQWNNKNSAIVYYITTSPSQPNQKPCLAFNQIFPVQITGDQIKDNPIMTPIIAAICSA